LITTSKRSSTQKNHTGTVVELDQATPTARSHRSKSDPQDATRAAREALGRNRHPSRPAR
jgi:hypothetical protein